MDLLSTEAAKNVDATTATSDTMKSPRRIDPIMPAEPVR
jgi:hypothetical protein